MTASNRSLSEVTTQVFNLVLRFTPESAFDTRLVSRRVRRNTDTFLQWHVRIIGAYCSEVQSSLCSLILREFARLCIQTQPRRAIQCHLSVTRSTRSMGVSQAQCPDGVLSVRDIGQFDSRIENTNLQKVWRRIHQEIFAANPWAAGVPSFNASAEAIRTWMRAVANRGLIAGITALDLVGLDLTCIPKEIALCTALQTLYLYNNQLVSLPEGLFQGLTALQGLYLSGNQIVFLPERLFQGLTALQELSLYNNQFVSLPEGLFQGLTALHTLYLSGNKIVSLPEGLFQGLTALQELSLYNNQLVSLPEGLFQGLTALQKLNLYSNQLVSLPEGLFQGLTALQKLNLYSNQLVSLPEGLFQGMTSLEILDLSGNQIAFLPEGLLKGLTSLQLLELFNNQLVSLPEELFQGLTALQSLYLYNNQLVSLPEVLFHGLTALQTLNLAKNQFVSFPEGLFQRLTTLRELNLYYNQLVSLPEGLFQGLTALQELFLYGNPRLLVPYKEPEDLNNIEFRDALCEFFNYDCQSPFARLYQLAARGAAPEAVRELFSELPSAIKNAVFGKVWKEAGCPDTDDPQWGEHHAFEDMPRFYGALKRYVPESFEALDSDGKNAVYGHVYHLAQSMEIVDLNDPQWGEHHAFDNILRLIDAMMQ